jgi:hypothetical protein
MFRFVMFICTLVAASATAHAQQSRDRLDGFNGIRFGMSFEEAKQALGSSAKMSTKAAHGGRKLNMLSLNVALDGQTYSAGYIFGTDDRMTLARITPHGVALGKDKDICLQVGTKMLTTLIGQYGKPNSEQKKGPDDGKFVFNFKDGNWIEAVSSFTIFCVTFASYYSPQGKDD